MKDLQKIQEEKLEEVTGGANGVQSVVTAYCPACQGEQKFFVFSGGRALCSKCHKEIMV